MRLESLTPSQKVQGRWIAVFADGSRLKLTDREMVDFSLYAGLDVPEAALEQLRDAAGESAARRRAAHILSARPMSREELVKRLPEQGGTPAPAPAHPPRPRAATDQGAARTTGSDRKMADAGLNVTGCIVKYLSRRMNDNIIRRDKCFGGEETAGGIGIPLFFILSLR